LGDNQGNDQKLGVILTGKEIEKSENINLRKQTQRKYIK